MPRLSSPIEQIKDHYEVLVIGSGYGGAIAASRMARAGRQVCILERGKEFQPGEYPDTQTEALGEMQTHLPNGHHIGPRTGLYDLHVNDDINVFVGCGLGGTSLVNANVSLRAEPWVLEDPRWPAEVQQDIPTLVADGYRRAEEMLKPTPYPEGSPGFPPLPKLEALKRSAASLNEKIYRPPINVTFEDGVNHVGVEQRKCTLCGDCCSGCNHGAKNTTLMNYLPDAKNHGAEIYTKTSVRYCERKNGRWLVHYQVLDSGREAFDAPTQFISADIVFLSAGTLGSAEILLRSREEGLPLSDKLGHRMTGNGDVLAFGYNGDKPINGMGFGHRKPGEMDPVGPCITGVIDIRAGKGEAGMVIEEGSVPGAIGPFMPAGLAAASAIGGRRENSGVADLVAEASREAASLIGGPYHGAVKNTQTYLVMTHDDGNGRMYLANDELRVDWPSVGQQPIFEKANDALFAAGKPLGGRYVENPIWTRLFNQRLITVHPLGGCVMAASAGEGVVNHKGQVFSGSNGTAVYDSLYVSDGSVVPRPLGVNPLLTISALAERCCVLAAQDRGWAIDYTLPFAPAAIAAAVAAPPAGRPEPMGLQFTETMRGFFSTAVKDDYANAAARGKAESSPFEFTLTVTSRNLDAMLSDESHQAAMVGTVTAPALSPEPLTVTGGIFHLFVIDADTVGQRRMTYNMKLTANDGSSYYFDGFKVTHSEAGHDVWADTSTLYITVFQGNDAHGPIAGKGILHIAPADFARQMTTLQVLNATSLPERLAGIARFGQFFGDTLFQTYGGVFARETLFDTNAPARKKRPLRVSAPELHFFATPDGIPLRLTRYRGGKKGPVMLSHGLGVSSQIFSIDTIDTNLTEYLFANGYDVWLLDYRSSTDLPASFQQATADDVATKDYPAAVSKVMEETGAQDVQMVVHCYGSTTFFMSMLSGSLKGRIRSVVCSQIANDVIAVKATRIKAAFHLPTVLEHMGVRSMTAETSVQRDALNAIFDHALDLLPIELKEHCHSPVCHRITFLYSLLYEHAQLNEATHDALHEMFGVAAMSALDHLSLLVRTKHLVNAKGDEVYMSHLDRLAVPIAFIHGSENQCFLPESTAITYEALRRANGKQLYSRHVIPGYGHIDCIFGKNAARDVYPHMLEHLEATSGRS